MADPKLINKVVYGGRTLIDLTGDTVTADKILKDFTAHDRSGAAITGTCEFDSDTTDADAAVAEILVGKTAYVNKQKITGTMVNNEGVEGFIETKEDVYNVPIGYHDGSGTVKLKAEEKAKLIPANIKKDIVLFGVTGTCDPASDVTAQAKEFTPIATEDTVVLPDEGKDYLSQVTVKKIPYTETENSAGGLTATIAG